MALNYNKTNKTNKWSNQKLRKHFNNSKRRCQSYARYQRCENALYYKKENQKYTIDIAIQYNPIPRWTCSNCTYYNIERHAKCAMCDLSYSLSKSIPSIEYNSDPTFTSKHWNNNLWDDKHNNGWSCSKCTYYNIAKIRYCQMCCNPYYKKKRRRKRKKRNKKVQQLQWSCTKCTLLNSMDVNCCILCKRKRYYDKSLKESQSSMNISKNEYDISIQLKLNTSCWFHGAKRSKMNADIIYYNLSESSLKISQTKDKTKNNYKKIIKYQLHPSASMKNILIPIKQSARYHNPLKSIASLMWHSRFNQFNTKPKWNNVDIYNLDEVNCYHNLIDILIEFIASYDVCRTILFQYIGSTSMNDIINKDLFQCSVGDIIKARVTSNGSIYNASRCQYAKARIIKIKYASQSLSKKDYRGLTANQIYRVEFLNQQKGIYIQFIDPIKQCRWVFIDKQSVCSCTFPNGCYYYNHLVQIYRAKDNNVNSNNLECVTVKIDGNISLNKNLFLHRDNDRIINDKTMLFMKENDNKLPFKLYDTKLNIIRERKYRNYYEFIEVGYHKNDIIEMNKEQQLHRNKINAKDMGVLNRNVSRVRHRCLHFKQNKKKQIKKRSIKRFYPKKYLKLRRIISSILNQQKIKNGKKAFRQRIKWKSTSVRYTT